MNKIMGYFVAMAFVMSASVAWSQTGVRLGAAPASSAHTLKTGPAKGTGYTCYSEDGINTCVCKGTEDCMLLKDSGKCTGEIYENDGGKTGECDSNGADAPGAGGLKLKMSTKSTRHGASRAKAGTGRGTAFVCNVTDKKSYCQCSGVEDCLSLADSGKCSGKIVTQPDEITGECNANTVDRPAPRPNTFSSQSKGGTEFGCSYSKKGNKQFCFCKGDSNSNDCQKLKENGACGSWSLDKDGGNSVCEP